MKEEKGFTLIELLAVIIILGVLMIIAIPSVTTYIQNSRKNAYVDTAKEIVGGARTLVNSGKLEMFDQKVTYYITQKCINMENGAQSPFGEFKSAYVGVVYNGDGYKYYWASVDASGQGIKDVTALDELDIDKMESNLDYLEVEQNIFNTGIDGRKTVLVLQDDCKTWNKETDNATINVGVQKTVCLIDMVGAQGNHRYFVPYVEGVTWDEYYAMADDQTKATLDTAWYYHPHEMKTGIITSKCFLEDGLSEYECYVNRSQFKQPPITNENDYRNETFYSFRDLDEYILDSSKVCYTYID